MLYFPTKELPCLHGTDASLVRLTGGRDSLGYRQLTQLNRMAVFKQASSLVTEYERGGHGGWDWTHC